MVLASIYFSYHVPDATTKSIPSDYIEEPDLIPGGDGRRWEEDRLMLATYHTGAKDARVVIFLNHQLLF